MKGATSTRFALRGAPTLRILRLPRAALLAGLIPAFLLPTFPLPAVATAASPEWVGVGSLFLPGLGQTINGDVMEGGAQFGLFLVLANQYTKRIEHPDYIRFKDREDEATNTIRINRPSVAADLYGAALGNLAFYSSFAAYRDARLAPENLAGYDTPPPTESLTDLAAAPFRLKYLSRPTAFIPLLLPLYFALSPADSTRLVFAPDDSISRNELREAAFVTHEMVAVGEEAFFRGFLNNGLSSRLGEPWGLITSSTIFGLGHQGNAGQANAITAGLFGAYLGWLQQRNGYAIEEGVAIHFWWNLLVTLGAIKQRSSGPVNLISLHLRF